VCHLDRVNLANSSMKIKNKGLMPERSFYRQENESYGKD